ncbi:hypothetical protein EXM22_13730 [Oceanispirochaeta crateris]|uniref:Cytochrome oxidase subunit III n=1 Tax=Oceanispirochaeta crateris TaxID=2518645 RepID=A0A5C1QN89_9SPIO|nr:hypothetical protein EXM22_13730 [Oceanispirochaeta crateris]
MILLKTNHKYQLCGWILFLLCAVLYLISGMKSKDYISIVGSILFFIACFVFLIPLTCEILDEYKKGDEEL